MELEVEVKVNNPLDQPIRVTAHLGLQVGGKDSKDRQLHGTHYPMCTQRSVDFAGHSFDTRSIALPVRAAQGAELDGNDVGSGGLGSLSCKYRGDVVGAIEYRAVVYVDAP